MIGLDPGPKSESKLGPKGALAETFGTSREASA
jgi:hypothetical protein